MIYIFRSHNPLIQKAKEEAEQEIEKGIKKGIVLLPAAVSFVTALADGGNTEVKINED